MKREYREMETKLRPAQDAFYDNERDSALHDGKLQEEITGLRRCDERAHITFVSYVQQEASTIRLFKTEATVEADLLCIQTASEDRSGSDEAPLFRNSYEE